MSNTGRESQIKGANGEHELSCLLQSEGYPVVWGGNKSYGKRPDLRGMPGIHIECKRVERLNISEAIRQAKTDSARFQDGSPTVFHRKNGEEWLVTMPFSEWIALYKQAQKATSLEHEQDVRARFFLPHNTNFTEEPKQPPFDPQKPNTKKGVSSMKAKYWENEQPIRVDTGKNVLEYYPEGGALNVCKPNYEKDGVIHRGKVVALDISALRNSPEAIKVLQAVIGA